MAQNLSQRLVGQRYSRVTTADHGLVLVIGPPASDSNVGAYAIQFNPSLDFSGSFAVLGRAKGSTAEAAGFPFLPFPYRRINVGNVAQAYELVSDLINGTAAIQVPGNAWTIALLVAIDAGMCDLIMHDVQGPSAV